MKEIILTATGDSLFTANVPNAYFEGLFLPIQEFLSDADVKMTNLETNVGEFGDFPNAYSGGTWLNCTPEDFDDLTKFGFNYYSTANNHSMDYSYHGLLSTIENLDKRNLAHSGTGKSLSEASAPAILSVNGQKLAIISVDTSHKEPSKAGEQTNTMKARPGVNYVDFTSYYPITREQLECLKEIAKTSNVNAYEQIMVDSGFSLSAPDGIYKFGNTFFCYDNSKKKTECNKKDLNRLVEQIKRAKEQNDYVILAVHCHEIGATKHEQVPDYFVELAHASIDAGCSAIIGNGTHQLRPLEIYNGCPIFYSLGDFIYQGMRVKYLPADFMKKYGVDINATAYEGLMARSKNNTIGLQTEKCNFLTVLPKMKFKDGKLCSLEMLPINAGFKAEGEFDGLPYAVKGDEAKEIFDILDKLSRPYGTKLKLVDDKIVLEG
ncbi:MAG: CapA family protein [Clostridia bacterium]|nr:CapA family protein [Clostridia bacterium]